MRVCVSVSVCFCALVGGLCVFGGGWGYQLLYIQGERLGGAVLPWPSRAGEGQVLGVFCRCVLVSAV